MLALALLAPHLLPAQTIEEEDLKEPELETAPQFADQDDAHLRNLFTAAEDLFFNSEDPNEALASFNRLLERIETRRLAGELSPTARELQLRSHGYRAELHFETGDRGAAEVDLGRMLELDPAAELDPDVVSAEILARFDTIRRQRVGALRITADPPDLELRIDGRLIALERGAAASADRPGAGEDAAPAGEPPDQEGEETEPPEPPQTVVPLLAGIRLLEAARPGYAPLAHEVEVEAGQETPFEMVLERTSAVLRLHTRPRAADVTVDGAAYGKTAGVAPEGFLPQGPAVRFRREEFSAELVVPDLEPGLRVLEVRKEGYRTHRAELAIRDLIDHRLPPIVLEQESGTLVLRNLRPDATLSIDGEVARPDDAGGSRFTLRPGEHHVQVAQGRTRMFSTRLRLADRQTIEINVRLRPGLAFLGVLGARSDDLARALRLTLADSERWSLLDRSPEARDVLPKAGFTVERARRAAAGDETAVDWPRVQTAVDARAPGLIYVAAVVADDLLASQADVWIWAAAPGPARPDRLRVDLGQQSEIERLREHFHRTVALRRPWLGALVVSTGAAPHPVVADLTPGGPLAATGVRAGDLIVAVSKVPVFSGGDVTARILAAETGETIDVGVQTPGGTQSVRAVLGTSPRLHSQPVPGVPDAIAYTELLLMSEEPGQADDAWVIRLNQALILLRSRDYEGAVRLLRGLAAPESPNGVGRATVDYWLGVALANSGPSYREAAIEALERAAGVPGARLDHHDGPWLAPRARARLLALRGGS